MSKANTEEGNLATGDVEGTTDANSMENGSEVEDTFENDVLEALGVSPEHNDEPDEDRENEVETDSNDDAAADEAEDIEEDSEEEDAEEGEDDSEDEEEDSEDEDEETTAMQARMDALKAEAETAKEKLEKSEATVAKLAQRIAASTPLPEDPFSTVDTVEDLDAERERLLKNKAFLRKNLDGFTMPSNDPDGEDEEISAERAREMLSEADRRLDEDLPKRKQFLEQRKKLDAEAKEVYPNIFDRNTWLGAQYQRSLEAMPGLARMPNAALIVGDALVGGSVRSGQFRLVKVEKKDAKKATSNDKPASKKAVNTAPKRTKSRPVKRNKKGDESLAKLAASSGDVDSLADSLEDLLM